LISNLAFLISIISLGNIKLKLVLQSFITSILDILKSFIKNIVIATFPDFTLVSIVACIGKQKSVRYRPLIGGIGMMYYLQFWGNTGDGLELVLGHGLCPL